MSSGVTKAMLGLQAEAQVQGAAVAMGTGWLVLSVTQGVFMACCLHHSQVGLGWRGESQRAPEHSPLLGSEHGIIAGVGSAVRLHPAIPIMGAGAP